jgi:hypothetical protein
MGATQLSTAARQQSHLSTGVRSPSMFVHQPGKIQDKSTEGRIFTDNLNEMQAHSKGKDLLFPLMPTAKQL